MQASAKRTLVSVLTAILALTAGYVLVMMGFTKVAHGTGAVQVAHRQLVVER